MNHPGEHKDGEASRRRIVEAAEGDPGLHVSELQERTGLAWHTVAYHLKLLVDAGQVVIEKDRRERRVFPAGLGAAERACITALRGEHAVPVLRDIAASPGDGVRGISQRVGFSEKIVRRHVVRLLRAGLLQRQGVVRPTYRLSPAATAWLADGSLANIGEKGT